MLPAVDVEVRAVQLEYLGVRADTAGGVADGLRRGRWSPARR